MRPSIARSLIVLLAACGPQKGDGDDSTSDAPGSTGELTTGDASTSTPTTSATTEASTGEPAPTGPCGEPQPDVADFALQLSIEPIAGPDEPPVFVEADCTIDARLDSDVQDGLALRCPDAGGELVLRATYMSNHLPLPASVVVGAGVHVRYATYTAEIVQRSIFVQSLDDARVVLAAHTGPGLVPFVDGIGELTDFWGPLAVASLASGCPGTKGKCQQEIHRAGMRFTAEADTLELFDHQLGQLGALGVQLADVIDPISDDNQCDGGSDDRRDFLVVHD